MTKLISFVANSFRTVATLAVLFLAILTTLVFVNTPGDDIARLANLARENFATYVSSPAQKLEYASLKEDSRKLATAEAKLALAQTEVMLLKTVVTTQKFQLISVATEAGMCKNSLNAALVPEPTLATAAKVHLIDPISSGVDRIISYWKN